MNIFVLYIDHTSDIIFKVILHLEVFKGYIKFIIGLTF